MSYSTILTVVIIACITPTLIGAAPPLIEENRQGRVGRTFGTFGDFGGNFGHASLGWRNPVFGSVDYSTYGAGGAAGYYGPYGGAGGYRPSYSTYQPSFPYGGYSSSAYANYYPWSRW